MPQNPKKLVLIDANALLHRGYHALPPLTTKTGEEVGAVYGFCLILLKVLKEIKPDYIVAAFDMKGPTFRHKEFKEYKAQRPKMSESLATQIPRVKQVLKSMNIPVFEKQSYEADDIIGTLDHQVPEKMETYIVTGDLDALQLVDEDTKVYTLRKGIKDTIIYDSKKIEERFRLKSSQLIDFKALRGDPSDNIPGVKGIGEKGAIKLIRKFGSLENVYKNLDKIESSVRKKLADQRKQAFLSKRLVTIETSVPLKFNLEKCAFKNYDREKVVKLFSEFEFSSLVSRLPGTNNLKPEEAGEQTGLFEKGTKAAEMDKGEVNYQIVDSEEKFKNLLKNLKESKGFVIDTETDRLDPVSGKLVGMSFAWEEKKAHYLDLRSEIPGAGDVIGKLKPILENETIAKYGHNIKYDLMVLSHYNIWVQGIKFDTMIASYLLNPGSRQHNLNKVAFTELGYEMMPISDLIGKGKEEISMAKVPSQKIAWYSCEDADITLRLVHKLKHRLEKVSQEQRKTGMPEVKDGAATNTLMSVFDNIEMPLVSTLARMELDGVKVDKMFLEKLSGSFGKMVHDLEDKIYMFAGREFNINSPQELQNILFNILKLPTQDIRRISTGFSTGAPELKKIRDTHPIIVYILKFRELSKIYSTYIEALPELINKETGRLHTSFNQAVTATGRLSSSDPNLQNIPTRTKTGREIRRAFIAERGYKLVSFDYSQVELRIVAALAQDEKMIEAFKKGEDIHLRTASEIFNSSHRNITGSLRRVAKTINFGILYGMSSYGVSQALGVSREQAQDFINNYFQHFPKIRDYIKKTINFARKHSYVETLLGRRRYLPEINSALTTLRRAAERMAINMPVQGSAADIMKIAMINISKISDSEAKMLLQVHDELLFEIREEKIKKVVPKIKQIMKEAYKLSVPLEVDVSVGKNWKEMEKK